MDNTPTDDQAHTASENAERRLHRLAGEPAAEALSAEALDALTRQLCDVDRTDAALTVGAAINLVAQCLAAEERAAMADQCLGMVSEALATLGCGCAPDAHSTTPPMMFPEWIGCVVAHHMALAASRYRELWDEMQAVCDRLEAAGGGPEAAVARGLRTVLRKYEEESP